MTGTDELAIAGAGASRPVDLESAVLGSGAVALPEAYGGPEALLVGDRSRLVLAVLCAGFGAPGELHLNCGDCGALHEVPFDPAAVLGLVPPGPVGDWFEVETDCGPIAMRLPTGADLVALHADGGALLLRCAPRAGDDRAVQTAVEAAIAARDPAAEIVFRLECAECGDPVQALLDPLTLLRGEMNRCGGIVAEVDVLARAYHWSEAELLALPAHRRRLYLEALSGAQDQRRAS